MQPAPGAATGAWPRVQPARRLGYCPCSKSSSAPRRHRAHELLTPETAERGARTGPPVLFNAKSPRAALQGRGGTWLPDSSPSSHSYIIQNSFFFRAICPDCLWAQNNKWFLSRVQRLAGPAGDRGILSRLEVPTSLLSRLVAPIRTKGPFCPSWCSNLTKGSST
jgi:hypothetical protein